MTAGEPVFVLRTDRDSLGDDAEGFSKRNGGSVNGNGADPGIGGNGVSPAGSRGGDTNHGKRLSRQQSLTRIPRNRALRRLASTGSSAAATISSSSSPSLAHSTSLTIGPSSPAGSALSPSSGKPFPRVTLGGGFGGHGSPSGGRPRPFSAHVAPGSSPKQPRSPSVAVSGREPGEWELMWRDAVTRTEASARGLVVPLQRGVEEAPARIQRGVVDGAVAIGGAANAVKVRAQSMAKAALGLLDRLDGDRLHCPRCKGSGLLSPSHSWSHLSRPSPSATNEPCWFCQGIGVMPIFDLSGFLVARCPPLISSRHRSPASSSALRFSSSFQLFLGKFPGTRTRLVTSRLPRMVRHGLFAPPLGPFCNPSQDDAVRAFCSRGDPSAPPSSSSSPASSASSPLHGSDTPAGKTAAAAVAAAASPAAAGSLRSPLGPADSATDSQESPKASPRRRTWQQQRQQEQQHRGSLQQAQEQQREQRRQQRDGEGRGGGCSGRRSGGRRAGSGSRAGGNQSTPQSLSANSNSNSSSGAISPGSVGDQTARSRSSAGSSPSADNTTPWHRGSSPLPSGTPGTAHSPDPSHPTATSILTSNEDTDGEVEEEMSEGAVVGGVWVGGAGGEFGQQQSPRSRSPRRDRNKVREKAERQAVERARVMQRTSGRGGSGGISEAAEALEGDSQGGANDLWWIVGARIRAAGSSFAPTMDFPSQSTSFSLIPSTPRAQPSNNGDGKKPPQSS